MRILRFAVLLAALPLAGCILAIDHGGRRGLEKRIERQEKRAERLERERGLPEAAPPRGR